MFDQPGQQSMGNTDRVGEGVDPEAIKKAGTAYRDLSMLFDPTKSPFLTPDYFPPNISVTPRHIKDAATKYERRKKAFSWRKLNGARLKRVMRILERAEAPEYTVQFSAWKPLPFYRDSILVHLELTSVDEDTQETHRLIVTSDNKAAYLSGKSPVIHELNAKLPIRLDDENVEEYLNFFCEHVHGEMGGFYVVESASRPVGSGSIETLHLIAEDKRVGPALSSIERSRKDRLDAFPSAVIAHPVINLERNSKDRRTLLATVCYAGSIFRVSFSVRDSGMIDMLEDKVVEGCAVEGLTLRWTQSVVQPRWTANLSFDGED